MPVVTSGRFAAATSVLALAVAMGGTGYAAAKIGGNQIKNNAITSKKVKDDSLTGSDVKESTIGTVPAARDELLEAEVIAGQLHDALVEVHHAGPRVVGGERLLGTRIYLDLKLKVSQGWRSDRQFLERLGL